MRVSRRIFLQNTTAAIAAAAALPARMSSAKDSTFAIPIGMELYTVSAELQKDFDGTLHALAAIGYRQVELPEYYGRNARELRKSLDAAGLKCESGMFFQSSEKPNLTDSLPECIELAHALGLKYMVCPWLDEADAAKTLDDFKRAADFLNRIGGEIRKAGLRFAYHNHNTVFRRIGDLVGYDELLRLTDPRLVAMEMDCGWVAAAGYDPARYLREHPGRFPLLHVKDLKAANPNTETVGMVPAEVGRGTVDWRKVFTAARASGVKMCYVEQEPPFVRPVMESARISYDFLRTLERGSG